MESEPFDHKPAYGNEYLLKSATFMVTILLAIAEFSYLKNMTTSFGQKK